MSDDDNFGDEGEGIKSLRKQYEATQKELAEARELVSKFQARDRQETVASILKAKGAPEAAARFYNAEDVSEDAVGKWLEANSDLFPSAQRNDNDENAQHAARVSAASFGQQAHETQGGKTNLPLGDPAELERLMRTLPQDKLREMGLLPASNPWR